MKISSLIKVKKIKDILFFSLSESSKSSPTKSPKKVKVEEYQLTQEQKTLIKSDKQNKKLWDEAMESRALGPVRMCFKLPL